MKNLHIFLAEVAPATRKKFLQSILTSSEGVQLDWRVKHVLATNIGNYSLLFDRETVIIRFLPLFFRYSFDQVSKVAEAAS